MAECENYRLWPTAYDTQNALASHVIALNTARKAAAARNPRFLTTSVSSYLDRSWYQRIDGCKQLKFIAQSNQATLVVSKPPLVGLLTNVGSKSATTTTWTVPGSEGLYQSGESVVNVLNCKVYQADEQGGVSVQTESGMPQVRYHSVTIARIGKIRILYIAFDVGIRTEPTWDTLSERRNWHRKYGYFGQCGCSGEPDQLDWYWYLLGIGVGVVLS